MAKTKPKDSRVDWSPADRDIADRLYAVLVKEGKNRKAITATLATTLDKSRLSVAAYLRHSFGAAGKSPHPTESKPAPESEPVRPPKNVLAVATHPLARAALQLTLAGHDARFDPKTGHVFFEGKLYPGGLFVRKTYELTKIKICYPGAFEL